MQSRKRVGAGLGKRAALAGGWRATFSRPEPRWDSVQGRPAASHGIRDAMSHPRSRQVPGPTAMPRQRRISAIPDCPNDGMLGLGMFPVPQRQRLRRPTAGIGCASAPSILACAAPVTTLPDTEHQFAMLASQSGRAFEEHSVVLIVSGMGRLISGEAQSGTGGALLAANSSVGGVVSGGACRPADHST